MSPALLSVDDVMENIGSLGTFQLRLICVLGYMFLTSIGFNIFSMTFLASEPSWQCTNQSMICNLTGTYGPGDLEYEMRCEMPRTEWKFVDEYTSVITEWDLVCSDSLFGSVASSMVFAGTFVGSVVIGMLSDVWGRKICVFLSVMVSSTASLISSFSVNIYMFKVCRFIVGIGVGGGGLIIIVLAMEFSGMKHRGTAGTLLSLFWSMSLILQALLAYFIRDWRILNTVLSVPGLISIFFWPLIPESPRWLLIRGKLYEASDVLLKVAGINRRVMPTGLLKSHPQPSNNKSRAVILELFQCWNVAKTTFIQWMIWFVIVLVYHGVSMSAGALGGNLYLNFFISGLVEIPSTIVSIWAMNKFGRKKVVMVGLVIASFTTALALVFHADDQNPDFMAGRMVMASVAKFSIFMAYNTIAIFSAEVFPTAVRNAGLGTCAAAGKLGSFATPYLLWTTRIHVALPYSIMGALALITLLLCMTLKETHMVPTAEVLPMPSSSVAPTPEPGYVKNVPEVEPHEEPPPELLDDDGPFVLPEPTFILSILPDSALSAPSA